MTRINVGIHASELCDQHLLAEYRELPRLFNWQSKSKPPPYFKLGPGHCLWCAQFKGSLLLRFKTLVNEMKQRCFKPNFSPPDEPPCYCVWTLCDIEMARPIVQGRIIERLRIMKRDPKWTNRKRPAWSYYGY